MSERDVWLDKWRRHAQDELIDAGAAAAAVGPLLDRAHTLARASARAMPACITAPVRAWTVTAAYVGAGEAAALLIRDGATLAQLYEPMRYAAELSAVLITGFHRTWSIGRGPAAAMVCGSLAAYTARLRRDHHLSLPDVNQFGIEQLVNALRTTTVTLAAAICFDLLRHGFHATEVAATGASLIDTAIDQGLDLAAEHDGQLVPPDRAELVAALTGWLAHNEQHGPLHAAIVQSAERLRAAHRRSPG